MPSRDNSAIDANDICNYAAHNQFHELYSEQDVILCLGKNGAGKSTTISIQLGVEFEYSKDDELKVKSSTTAHPQMSSGLTSKTLNLGVYKGKNTMTYVDTAGVNESRSQTALVWTRFSTALAFQLVKTLIPLIVIDCKSLNSDRANGIRELAQILEDFVGNRTELFYDSAIFVFTKTEYIVANQIKKMTPEYLKTLFEELREIEEKKLNENLSRLAKKYPLDANRKRIVGRKVKEIQTLAFGLASSLTCASATYPMKSTGLMTSASSLLSPIFSTRAKTSLETVKECADNYKQTSSSEETRTDEESKAEEDETAFKIEVDWNKVEQKDSQISFGKKSKRRSKSMSKSPKRSSKSKGKRPSKHILSTPAKSLETKNERADHYKQTSFSEETRTDEESKAEEDETAFKLEVDWNKVEQEDRVDYDKAHASSSLANAVLKAIDQTRCYMSGDPSIDSERKKQVENINKMIKTVTPIKRDDLKKIVEACPTHRLEVFDAIAETALEYTSELEKFQELYERLGEEWNIRKYDLTEVKDNWIARKGTMKEAIEDEQTKLIKKIEMYRTEIERLTNSNKKIIFFRDEIRRTQAIWASWLFSIEHFYVYERGNDGFFESHYLESNNSRRYERSIIEERGKDGILKFHVRDGARFSSDYLSIDVVFMRFEKDHPATKSLVANTCDELKRAEERIKVLTDNKIKLNEVNSVEQFVSYLTKDLEELKDNFWQDYERLFKQTGNFTTNTNSDPSRQLVFEGVSRLVHAYFDSLDSTKLGGMLSNDHPTMKILKKLYDVRKECNEVHQKFAKGIWNWFPAQAKMKMLDNLLPGTFKNSPEADGPKLSTGMQVLNDGKEFANTVIEGVEALIPSVLDNVKNICAKLQWKLNTNLVPLSMSIIAFSCLLRKGTAYQYALVESTSLFVIFYNITPKFVKFSAMVHESFQKVSEGQPVFVSMIALAFGFAGLKLIVPGLSPMMDGIFVEVLKIIFFFLIILLIGLKVFDRVVEQLPIN